MMTIKAFLVHKRNSFLFKCHKVDQSLEGHEHRVGRGWLGGEDSLPTRKEITLPLSGWGGSKCEGELSLLTACPLPRRPSSEGSSACFPPAALAATWRREEMTSIAQKWQQRPTQREREGEPSSCVVLSASGVSRLSQQPNLTETAAPAPDRVGSGQQGAPATADGGRKAATQRPRAKEQKRDQAPSPLKEGTGDEAEFTQKRLNGKLP